LKLRRRTRIPLAIATAAVAVAGLTQSAAPAWAGSSGTGTAAVSPASETSPAPTQAESSRVLAPDTDLPKSWKSSADRVVTVAGDGSGLHVLAADSGRAYQWRTVATLGEAAFGTDLWIGNACVTGSGKRAVVVYAPREFTNSPDLMEHGGFAAVVDLTSGKVTKLADTVTLGYFNPGCGTGETAVLTQLGDDKDNQTRLLTVDTVTGQVIRKQTENVEVTSAVPNGDTIVGAAAGRLIGFDRKNHATSLGTTSGAASQLRVDSQGGVSFLDHASGKTRARRAFGGKTTTFAQGPSGSLGLQSGTGGRVFLTGDPASTTALPSTVRRLKVAADATVSSTGAIAVDQAVSSSLRSHVANPLAATAFNSPATLQISTEVPATGKKLAFTAGQDYDKNDAGRELSPALTGAGGTSSGTGGAKVQPRSATKSAGTATVSPQVAGDPNTPIDNDRTCSMARNDATQQAYQPTPNQVQWAADMAVRGDLTSTYVRQGGWRTADGLGTVNPQGMFPLPGLVGGGRIPAQVLLGVLAQESNLWQAEGGALPGQTSSTLASTDGFYGHPALQDGEDPEDHWLINWDKADCGYGIGQQTDGMKNGDVNPLPANQQKAIALDYTSNIAVAARTLEVKWNELHTTVVQPNTITLHTDSASNLENWFAALWDYNSGFNFYNPAAPASPWGLGYLNNPDNPLYPQDRAAFLDNNSYADAAHPERWSYEEKVLGWAAWPIDTGRAYSDSGQADNSNTAGYSAAWWNTGNNRSQVKPPLGTFCKPDVNDCHPEDPPRCEVDHLGASCDPPHWYHQAITSWQVDCPDNCGHELMVYQTLKAELGNGNNGTGHMCDNSVPAGAVVVDDVPNSVPALTDGCSKAGWSNAGTFSFSPFNPDPESHYEAKADLHQIGGGFGDHFWYAHTRTYGTGVDNLYSGNLLHTPQISGNMAVTGTWKLSQQLTGWTRVLVHLPDTGSQTQDATYTIHAGGGASQNRTLNVHKETNSWVSLGVFQFSPSSTNYQGVSLSNWTNDGNADEDVSWDSVAFQILPQKPKDIVVQMGDSYSSGTGTGPYDFGTATGPYADIGSQSSPGHNWNACLRSPDSWGRQARLPGTTTSVGARTDALDKTIEYHSVACNGAFVYDLDSSLDTDGDGGPGTLGQYGEVPQLDSGFLNDDTTLVALTITGNDAEFGNTVADCANPLKGCPSDATVKANIAGATSHLEQLLKNIHSLASHAKIVLMGYPQLFGSHTPCIGVIASEPRAQLDGWALNLRDSEMAQVVKAVDDGVQVMYMSPDTEFDGHRVCDSANGINDYVAGPASDNPADFSCPGAVICPGMESYHPNSSGTPAYARAFEDALNVFYN
jgi:hypothetical protein